MPKSARGVPEASPFELSCGQFRRDRSYFTRRPSGRNDWLLIYTVSGSGRIVSEEGTYVTQPGDILLYAPHDMQDYGTASEATHWDLMWAHFHAKPNWLPWLGWPATEFGLKLLKLDTSELRKAFEAAMRRMVEHSTRPLPIATDLALVALEEALLWARLAADQDQWLTMDPRIRRAIDYLATQFRDPFQMGKLARHVGLSISRLAHLFTAQAGVSPQQFLERHRMQIAARLLRLTDFRITEIAAEVGYDDPFYFSNRFHRYSGKSPSKFRLESSR